MQLDHDYLPPRRILSRLRQLWKRGGHASGAEAASFINRQMFSNPYEKNPLTDFTPPERIELLWRLAADPHYRVSDRYILEVMERFEAAKAAHARAHKRATAFFNIARFLSFEEVWKNDPTAGMFPDGASFAALHNRLRNQPTDYGMGQKLGMLQFVADRYSEFLGIERVTVGMHPDAAAAGEDGFYNWRTRLVAIDPAHIENNYREAFITLAHELDHAAQEKDADDYLAGRTQGYAEGLFYVNEYLHFSGKKNHAGYRAMPIETASRAAEHAAKKFLSFVLPTHEKQAAPEDAAAYPERPPLYGPVAGAARPALRARRTAPKRDV